MTKKEQLAVATALVIALGVGGSLYHSQRGQRVPTVPKPSVEVSSLLVGFYVGYREAGQDVVETVPALHFPGFGSVAEAQMVAERIAQTDVRSVAVYHARRGVLVKVEE